MMNRAITGVILAGGKSSRMGLTKAFLPFRGTTLIEHIISEIQPYCEKLLISANETAQYTHLGLEVINDRKKDCGPLGGLDAVSTVVNTEYCFAVSCDLPYFSGEIIALLAAEIADADICVPVLNGYYEPLVALYSKKALLGISKCIEEERFKVIDAFKGLKVRRLEESKLREKNLRNIFLNINTNDDYKKLLRSQDNG